MSLINEYKFLEKLEELNKNKNSTSSFLNDVLDINLIFETIFIIGALIYLRTILRVKTPMDFNLFCFLSIGLSLFLSYVKTTLIAIKQLNRKKDLFRFGKIKYYSILIYEGSKISFTYIAIHSLLLISYVFFIDITLKTFFYLIGIHTLNLFLAIAIANILWILSQLNNLFQQIIRFTYRRSHLIFGCVFVGIGGYPQLLRNIASKFPLSNSIELSRKALNSTYNPELISFNYFSNFIIITTLLSILIYILYGKEAIYKTMVQRIPKEYNSKLTEFDD